MGLLGLLEKLKPSAYEPEPAPTIAEVTARSLRVVNRLEQEVGRMRKNLNNGSLETAYRHAPTLIQLADELYGEIGDFVDTAD